MKKSMPPKPTSSPATSGPPSPPRIILTKRFGKVAGKLTPGETDAVNAALQALPDSWGNPHVHGGYSVRRLAPGLYEIRAGLGLRVVFDVVADRLRCDFVGNHDDVQTYLRNRA
jgi:hypothetical protein